MNLKDTDDTLEEVTVGYMCFDCFQVIYPDEVDTGMALSLLLTLVLGSGWGEPQ